MGCKGRKTWKWRQQNGGAGHIAGTVLWGINRRWKWVKGHRREDEGKVQSSRRFAVQVKGERASGGVRGSVATLGQVATTACQLPLR